MVDGCFLQSDLIVIGNERLPFLPIAWIFKMRTKRLDDRSHHAELDRTTISLFRKSPFIQNAAGITRYSSFTPCPFNRSSPHDESTYLFQYETVVRYVQI